MVYKPLLENYSFHKLRLYWLGAAIAFLGIGAWTLYQQHPLSSRRTVAPAISQVALPQTVAAVGRIEPQGSIIKLSVANAKDSRVNKVLVQEGDQVKAEEIIAILQGLDKQQAALVEAQAEIQLQEAMLSQAKVGTTTKSDRLAQLAVIQGLQAQLKTEARIQQANLEEAQSSLSLAQAEYNRFQMLHQDGAISSSELDEYKSSYTTAVAQVKAAQSELNNQQETLTAQLREAEAQLSALDEVQPEAIQVAQAGVDVAKREFESLQASLEDYYVRAPIDGQILSINTQVGEQVSAEEGIVDLAQTDQMYVVAEVYETDVPKVKAGQAVTISSENGGFIGELAGTVDRVGLQIKKTDILNTDPASDKNARVVEVKIRLNEASSPQVAGLSYMQVRTKIQLES